MFTPDYLWLADDSSTPFPSPSAPFRGILALLAAISVAPELRLDELVIRPGTYNAYDHEGLSNWVFDRESPQLDVLESRCRSLKRLTLSISASGSLNEPPNLEKYWHRRLTRLIRAASNLEHVHLDIESADPAGMLIGETVNTGDPGSHSSPSADLEHCHYPHLKSATFMGADISYVNLIRFLRSHKSTLQFLRVEESSLHGGSWRQFLLTLRTDVDLLCLRSEASRGNFALKLDYVADDEYPGDWFLKRSLTEEVEQEAKGDPLMEYLKNATDEYPLVKDGGCTPPPRMFD